MNNKEYIALFLFSLGTFLIGFSLGAKITIDTEDNVCRYSVDQTEGER